MGLINDILEQYGKEKLYRDGFEAGYKGEKRPIALNGPEPQRFYDMGYEDGRHKRAMEQLSK